MWSFKKDDIIIQPKVHKYTLVWLPGWTRTPKVDKRVFQNAPMLQDMRIRILMAPSRKITSNSRLSVPSWYEGVANSFSTIFPSLNEISHLVDEIIQEEYDLCQNVFLGGFSQGGATAVYTGLVISKVPLLGVIALSAPPFPFKIKLERKKIPVFVYMGGKDEILNEEITRERFKNLLIGMTMNYTNDEMLGHMYSWKEFVLLKKWMKSIAPAEHI